MTLAAALPPDSGLARLHLTICGAGFLLCHINHVIVAGDVLAQKHPEASSMELRRLLSSKHCTPLCLSLYPSQRTGILSGACSIAVRPLAIFSKTMQ